MSRLDWCWGAIFAGIIMSTACSSDAARQQRAQAEATRQVAEDEQDRTETTAHDESLNEASLRAQEKLDAVEQKRTNNVYAHSCRKAKVVNIAFPPAVDASACTPEQLKLEKEAEERQKLDELHDAAMKSLKKDN